MKAVNITKRPGETHRRYVNRKLRAAAKEGARLAFFPAVLGDDEICGDFGSGYMLLACVRGGEGKAVVNRINEAAGR